MNGPACRIMNPHRWKLLLEGWEVSPGGGHGSPIQYSFLENPMDSRAWWSTVLRATQSQTWLKQLGTESWTGGALRSIFGRARHFQEGELICTQQPPLKTDCVPGLGTWASCNHGLEMFWYQTMLELLFLKYSASCESHYNHLFNIENIPGQESDCHYYRKYKGKKPKAERQGRWDMWNTGPTNTKEMENKGTRRHAMAGEMMKWNWKAVRGREIKLSAGRKLSQTKNT